MTARYPSELERAETIADLGTALLRPVRAGDGPAIEAFFARLSPEDIHLRFFSALRRLPPHHLDLLTGIDFDRDMALMLVEPATDEILGVARLVAYPDPQRAEFAVTVRSDLHHHGIGGLLMHRILDVARARGLLEVYGDILAENHIIIRLARKLGFSLHRDSQSPGIVHATLDPRAPLPSA